MKDDVVFSLHESTEISLREFTEILYPKAFKLGNGVVKYHKVVVPWVWRKDVRAFLKRIGYGR